jgi:hypothetical protein
MKDKNLTTEEAKVLSRIELAGKWDILFYDLAHLVPCSIIIIISAIYNSTVGIFIGLITFSVLHLWTSISQCKSMPAFKSAIIKMKNRCQQNHPADPE